MAWQPTTSRTRSAGALERPVRSRPRRGGVPAEPWLEDLWDRHGGSVYTVAFALLGDEATAGQAVLLGLGDLANAQPRVSNHDALRSWAGQVYLRSQDMVDDGAGTRGAPSAMMSLRQLAHQQRACLVLCLFGGHTARDVANLLGLAPKAAAEMLRNALKEAERLSAGGSLGHA